MKIEHVILIVIAIVGTLLLINYRDKAKDGKPTFIGDPLTNPNVRPSEPGISGSSWYFQDGRWYSTEAT